DDSGPGADRADMTHQPRKQERHDERGDERQDHRPDGHMALAIRSAYVLFGPAERGHPLLAEHAVPDRADEPGCDGCRDDRDIVDRWHFIPPRLRRAPAKMRKPPLVSTRPSQYSLSVGKGAGRGVFGRKALAHSAARFALRAPEVAEC